MNAVFQGGGIKGLAYVGALRYLEERGIRFQKCAGTSIGAIMSALIICGYRSKELEKVINHIDVDELWKNEGKNFFSKTYKTIKKGSLYSLEPLEKLLEKLFMNKGYRTFRDVKVGNDYRLKMITTYLKEKKLVVIPNDLIYFGIDPDSFSLAKGACMSSAIPLVYNPYKIKEFSFIDGGVIDNFPLWLFDDAIGFKLSKENEIITFAQNKLFRAPQKKEKDVIYIDTSDYRATDFRKGYKERYYLYNLGYYHTKLYFDNYFRKK